MQTLRCACGSVEMEVNGAPMASTVCYCDTCQEGSRQIEELPGAAPILGPDGGTEYVLYREDRVRFVKGEERIKGYKLDEKSTTNRVAATCCNSAMMMRFEDAKHWVCIYRARFQGEAPPLQWRVCTKFAPANAEIPKDVPTYEMYPPGLMFKLLTSKLAVLFGR